MRRRTVLTVCGSSLTALAGCLGGDEGTVTPTPSGGWDSEIPSSSPTVSCSAVSRPMATTVERAGALDPRAYPGPPPANLTDEAAQEYVTDFELAYRQNDEMRSSTDISTDSASDSYLTRFDISVQESWIAAGPADSIVVRLRYVGSGTVHPGTEFDYLN